MKTKPKYPFTAEQFTALSEEERQAVLAVTEYLGSSNIEISDAGLSGALNLMKRSEGGVPREEIGDDVLQPIRRKFSAIFEIAIELAEAELKERGSKQHTDFNFCLVIDPSFDAETHVVVLDYDRPVCYLHEWREARKFAFANLSKLAKAVLSAKAALVDKAIAFTTKEIRILVEGGVVHEVLNVPPNIQITVLDYDTEGAERECLEISPVDGELCAVSRFFGQNAVERKYEKLV